ncbi:Rv3235 family protein [Cellulomonas soli]|uniref:Rv3235 family protein n=1 Tax=Cellulomonas soli TaxID=931535 RepID=UPI003F8656FA
MSPTTLEHEPGPVEEALSAPTPARAPRTGAPDRAPHDDRPLRDVVREPGAAPTRRRSTSSRPAPAGPPGQPTPRMPRDRPRAGTTPGSGAPRIRLVPSGPSLPAPTTSTSVHAVPQTVGARIEALRAADRSTVVEAADEPRGPVPTADLRHTSGAVAHAVLEVLAGTRPLAQLARWVTPGVYEALRTRTELTVRVLGAGTGRRPLVRRVRVCPVDPHAAEATVVAHDGHRVRAVALRFETHRGAWRVTALEVG